MWRDISKQAGKPLWINLNNVSSCDIRMVERLDEKKKKVLNKITDEPIKDYYADIIVASGVSFSIRFDSEQDAKDFLLNEIIEA